MNIIKAECRLHNAPEYTQLLWNIEWAGRTCYKSVSKGTIESAEQFAKMLIKNGHESVLEHASLTVRFICDRGISHEIVRHRLAAYSQESTRYANYSHEQFGNEITVIKPNFLRENTEAYDIWKASCEQAEKAYFDMLKIGCLPEEARSVLPNSLKTEVVMTADIREWRHFLRLRTAKAAHPQMREVAIPLLQHLKHKYPALFNDIKEEYK